MVTGVQTCALPIFEGDDLALWPAYPDHLFKGRVLKVLGEVLKDADVPDDIEAIVLERHPEEVALYKAGLLRAFSEGLFGYLKGRVGYIELETARLLSGH